MRLTFLCAAATASSRTGGFPSPDEPLDEGGRRKAAAFACRVPRVDRVLSSPSRSAIETLDALGIEGDVEPMFADLDFGTWTGRSLVDVQGATPELLARWMNDPTAATPGGETMASLVDRVGSWMATLAQDAGDTLVVSHASVMRAALCNALAMPVASAMRIDIAPLATLALSHRSGWRLQELWRPGER